jgi:SAM-dependent methyltransferase
VYEELRARSRAIWGKGDYGPASRQLEPAAVALVETLSITPGLTVLDVAAGHANCAVAAARRGAAVVATDFSPTMIEVGSARTRDADLDVTWQEADAAALPFEDGMFDRVTSTFGAIFAPEQDVVAAEAVRVVRPGGLIGFTAWTPDGVTARMLAVSQEYGPARPPGTPDPFRWGAPDEVAGLFEPLGCEVRTRRRAVTFQYASWEQWQRDSECHGMAVVAREMMPVDAYTDMRARMQAVTAEYDHGEGDSVAFDADYLEIIVSRSA